MNGNSFDEVRAARSKESLMTADARKIMRSREGCATERPPTFSQGALPLAGPYPARSYRFVIVDRAAGCSS